jgi:transposase InsO family protein
VIVHSDRQRLEQYRLQGSMSAKDNCYDNACTENFFHSLKVKVIHCECFVTREALCQTVFEYIETNYNLLRLHSANYYQSPLNVEADFYQPLAS